AARDGRDHFVVARAAVKRMRMQYERPACGRAVRPVYGAIDIAGQTGECGKFGACGHGGWVNGGWNIVDLHYNMSCRKRPRLGFFILHSTPYTTALPMLPQPLPLANRLRSALPTFCHVDWVERTGST